MYRCANRIKFQFSNVLLTRKIDIIELNQNTFNIWTPLNLWAQIEEQQLDGIKVSFWRNPNDANAYQGMWTACCCFIVPIVGVNNSTYDTTVY